MSKKYVSNFNFEVTALEENEKEIKYHVRTHVEGTVSLHGFKIVREMIDEAEEKFKKENPSEVDCDFKKEMDKMLKELKSIVEEGGD